MLPDVKKIVDYMAKRRITSLTVDLSHTVQHKNPYSVSLIREGKKLTFSTSLRIKGETHSSEFSVSENDTITNPHFKELISNVASTL